MCDDAARSDTAGRQRPVDWIVAAVHCSAGGAHPLDDRWGVAGGLAWVLDGATDLPGRTDRVHIPGAAGNASWLAEHTSVALGRTAPDGSAVERLASAIAAVDAEATGLGIGERVGFPTAVGVLATALAGPSTLTVDITLLGDCIAVVETSRGRVLVRDTAFAPEARAHLPADPDRALRNTALGVWVIRREPEAAEHAHRQLVPEATGRVLLCSDGAERALRRPGTDVDALFDAAFADPDAFVAGLRAWEDTEPAELPTGWTRHDDVTMLALEAADGDVG